MQNKAPNSLLYRLKDAPWGKIYTVILLVAIYFSAVGIRTASFLAQGQSHSQQYWVESAQHFRNVRMVYETGHIPEIDIDLEYPTGLRTRTHTIHNEYLIGYLARLLPYQDISYFFDDRLPRRTLAWRFMRLFLPLDNAELDGFVRYFVRYAGSLIIFPLFLAGLYFSRSRVMGLLVALLYAASFPAISRTLGDTFYHEHVALPCLAFHLYFLAKALDESKWSDIFLTWLFLFLALLFWKVIGFYALALNGYFVLSYFANRFCLCQKKVLLFITAGNAILPLFLNIHLHYDQYWQSPTMLAAFAVLIAAYLEEHHYKGHKRLYGIATFFLILSLAMWLIPQGGRYTHVWDTLFAKMRYWNKPLDPSLLSYEARHYWVEPYTTPPLFWFLQDVGPLLILAIYPMIWAGRMIWKRRLSHGKEVWFYLSLCFLFFYLLFFKMKTFVAILFPVMIAFPFPQETIMHVWDKSFKRTWHMTACIIFAGPVLLYILLLPLSLIFSQAPSFETKFSLQWPYSGYNVFLLVLALMVLSIPAAVVAKSETVRKSVRKPLLALTLIMFVVSVHAYIPLVWDHSVIALSLVKMGIKQSNAKHYTRVATGSTIPDFLDWAKRNTKEDEAFLCEFVLSPSIITYANRPVNQHCFFESDMRNKFRQFVESFFEPESVMYEFCLKYDTTYLVYNSHILFRDDPEMSFRYIANETGWDENWLAYKMQFRPEQLQHFQLVYQNDFIRVFKVLPPEQEPKVDKIPFAPMYSESIFNRFIEQVDEAGPPEFLYDMIEAQELLDRAITLLKSGHPQATKQGMVFLAKSLEKNDLIPEAHNLMGQILLKTRNTSLAKKHFRSALELNPGDPVAKKYLENIEAGL